MTTPRQPSITPPPLYTPLRLPLSGGIVSGAFRFLWKASGVILSSTIAFAVVLLAAVALFSAVLVSELITPVGAVILATTIVVVLLFGGMAVLHGVSLVTLGCLLSGRRATLLEVWSTTLRRLPGLLVVHLLTVAIVYGIPLLGGLLLFVVEIAGLDIPFVFRLLVGLLIAAAWIIGIHQWVVLSLAAPAYLLEGIGPIAALGRARDLAQGHWWRIVWVFVLAHLAAYLVIGGSVVVTALIGTLMSEAADVPWGVPLLIFFPVLSVQLFTLPYAAGVVGLIHMDLRIRRDQFTLV
jgi:hypothetical protein